MLAQKTTTTVQGDDFGADAKNSAGWLGHRQTSIRPPGRAQIVVTTTARPSYACIGCSRSVTDTAFVNSLPSVVAYSRIARAPMPYLKDFDYYVAAVCSVCGDTLFARHRDRKDDAQGATRLRANLEEVFQRHIAEKHRAKDELDRTA